MNDINNGYDRHLDPPDEPEAEYCESCGKEMEYEEYTYSGGYRSDKSWSCKNQFCPDKFDKKDGLLVHELAEHLAEVEQELADTKNDLKYANARIANLITIRIRREDRIQELEEEIEKLTQSQQGEITWHNTEA